MPGMGSDLREFELGVARVHLSYLLTSGRAKDFDDLDELVNPAVTGKY